MEHPDATCVKVNTAQKAAYLKNDDRKENTASDRHVLLGQYHAGSAQLADQIVENENGRQEPACERKVQMSGLTGKHRSSTRLTAAPTGVHIVALFVPLEPHTEAILDEGGHQAETAERGQDKFRVSQKILGHILCLRDQFVLIELVHCVEFLAVG